MTDFLESLKEAAATPATTLKDMAKPEQGGAGMSPVYHVSPLRIEIEEGFNPRDVGTPDRQGYIDWMAQNIKDNGVLRPLIVRMNGDGRLMLVDGECRLRGARRAIEHYGAELKTVPVQMEPKGTTDADRLARVVSIYNNSNPLTSLEQAQACARLKALGWAEDQIGKRFNISRERVYQLMEVLALPEEVKGHVRSGAISPTLAVAAVKEHGAEAATQAISEVAAENKASPKRGKVKKAKAAQIAEKAPRKSNAVDKDNMKAFDKGASEAMEVMRTLWQHGRVKEDNGTFVVTFSRDKYARIVARLGL